MAASLLEPTSGVWRDALARVPHQIYHLPEYVTFDARIAGGVPRAFVFERNGDVFVLPLVLRNVPGTDLWDALSPYGYPGPVSSSTSPEFWRHALRALVEVTRAHALVSLFVRLDPLTPVPLDELARAGTLVCHGRTVSIDLGLAPDQWWAQVRRDHREGINRSIRRGHSSVVDDWSYLGAFQSLYQETMERVGASTSYRFGLDYFQSLHDTLGRHAHLIMILTDSQEPIAGSILLAAAGIIQAHLAGTRTARKREESTRFMTHQVVSWGRANNCRTFHLGGGVGGREDSVFDFKKGFSPNHHPFSTLRMVLRPAIYRDLVLCRAPGADPDDCSGYFPGYRGDSGRAAELSPDRAVAGTAGTIAGNGRPGLVSVTDGADD